MLEDWENWRHNDPPLFETFFEVVCRLFGSKGDPNELPSAGPAIQLTKADERLIPTLEFPYGRVPVTHLSAGMRRILGLAYALVWAWTGHQRAARAEGVPPASHMVVLLDEVESHLHPRWQRLLLPALLSVIELLSPEVSIQLLATSHSPLALASMSTIFDAARDKLFHFELNGGVVGLDEVEWANFGDASGWLTSPIFGLAQPSSLAAEHALEAARALLRGQPSPYSELATPKAVEAELQRTVTPENRLWGRWKRWRGEEGS